jgi:putative two-component system response regulator
MQMEKKQTVLIVDDTPDSIEILEGVLNESYHIKVAKSGEMALKIAEKTSPDIILLDIVMPHMDGYEVCKRLKSNPITKGIPIIFVSAKGDAFNEARGLEIGAVDYITKPISASIVLSRVKTHLSLYSQSKALEFQVAEKTKELTETRIEIIRRLGMAAEFRDNETGMHIYRVSEFCKTIALHYGFPENEAELLLNVSPMHDIGKLGVPDSILQKPGKLTEEEFEVVKKHTVIGATIIGDHKSDLLRTAKMVALEHHERWDGKGYPRGLIGIETNIFARITALADVFDALTSKRPYKEAWKTEEALEYIRQESGKHFDPKVVEAFFKGIDRIYEIQDRYKE